MGASKNDILFFSIKNPAGQIRFLGLRRTHQRKTGQDTLKPERIGEKGDLPRPAGSQGLSSKRVQSAWTDLMPHSKPSHTKTSQEWSSKLGNHY